MVKISLKIILIPLVFGLMAGCSCRECCSTQGKTNLEDERTALMDADRAFAQRSTEIGFAEAFSEFLTENALALSDGMLPVTGRESIVSNMRKIDPGIYLHWAPEDARVAASGDFGYSWGFFSSRHKDDPDPKKIFYGKYLNIWVKDTQGAWKVAVDTGNSNPPPPIADVKK